MSNNPFPTIAICSTSFCANQDLLFNLTQRFSHQYQLKINSDRITFSEETLVPFLAGAEFAIIGREPITDTVLQKLPNLRAITKYGVGLDNIDLEAATSRGIEVKHTPGVNAQAVAELTIAMMISLFRNIGKEDRNLHQGIWHKDGGRLFSGKTVGIIGCGEVGSRVAKLAQAFDCPILIHDISKISKFSAWQVSLENLLTQSDVVSLHVPLTSLSLKMISVNELSLMKRSAFLINTSRGEVCNQKELLHALKTDLIKGAALDVYEREPLTDASLYKLDNVVLTPHIGGNALEAVLAMGHAAMDRMAEIISKARVENGNN